MKQQKHREWRNDGAEKKIGGHIKEGLSQRRRAGRQQESVKGQNVDRAIKVGGRFESCETEWTMRRQRVGQTHSWSPELHAGV